MIPAGIQVFVCIDPVDLRAGFERLAGYALERVGYEARCGALFVFFGKRRDAAKLLFHDGTGMCLFHKRLDKGAFQVPSAGDEPLQALELDEQELSTLLDGLPIGLVEPEEKAPMH